MRSQMDKLVWSCFWNTDLLLKSSYASFSIPFYLFWGSFELTVDTLSLVCFLLFIFSLISDFISEQVLRGTRGFWGITMQITERGDNLSFEGRGMSVLLTTPTILLQVTGWEHVAKASRKVEILCINWRSLIILGQYNCRSLLMGCTFLALKCSCNFILAIHGVQLNWNWERDLLGEV